MSPQQRQILQQIRALHQRGEPLNISAVKRNHPALLQAVMSLRHFRGWRKALEAAGLDYRQVRVQLAATLSCAECGAEVTCLPGHLQRRHRLTVAQYRQRHGTDAVLAEQHRARQTYFLGRPPHWEPVWSREYLIDYLIYKHERGEDLSPWHMYQHEPWVHANLRVYFGSYRAAIEAAGIDYRSVRRIPLTQRWTKARVLARIRELERERPLTSTLDLRARDSRLWDRCHHYFGTATIALATAGLSPEKLRARRPRVWDHKKVLRSIRDLDRQGVLLRPVLFRASANGQAGRLLGAASHYFGSWGKAVRKAGVDYQWHLRQRRPDAIRSA